MTHAQGSSSAIRTILIADDSTTERLHLTQTLEQAGYRVIAAQSGNEAKILAEQHKPDLVLLDILMNDGDGYQACRAIKRNPLTQNIPVLMVSSKNNDVDKQWAQKLGASGYITKPYTSETILQEIDNYKISKR